ncbi:hypothetical protein SADUNF_Sadunf16G0004600 [Salix dunnii]|uniref:Uncharacterized protein n=1 Tax=Salix dunnii TaxID=1413687 RepID=A0A835J788_9ROSI|nr:hypothetical protein SADUNF_Sadunf16G0004600 [Salix dunnii]
MTGDRPGKESNNMGCISSKLVSRSLSFQEELTKNMQRSANDIPALDELAISGNINDHFFALVCTANKVACKYKSGSSSDKSHKPVVEPDTSLAKTKPEFNSSLEQGEEKHGELEAKLVLPQLSSIDPTKRSRSSHFFPANEVSYPSVESFHGVEEKRRSHEGLRRAKSFHTIEEFDALIEKLNLSKEQKIGHDGEDDGSVTGVKLNHFRSSTHASEHSKDSNNIQETNSHINDSSPPEANTTMEENLTLSTSELAGKKLIAISSRSNTATESIVVEDSSQGHVLKKGFKRKSIAKRLESIEIPQIIEFPAITGLKEWLRVGGQVYSAGDYVTPKFGSYSFPISSTSYDCNEEDIFNPELVAACEESMEQLEAEAENILKQIVEKLEEESGLEKQAKDDFLSHDSTDQDACLNSQA